MRHLAYTAALAICASQALASIGTLTKLRALNSGFGSTPEALSADGSVVGGSSSNGLGATSTRWSGPDYTNLQTVGSFGPGLRSAITGLSADGLVATGTTEVGFQDRRGFVRTAAGTIIILDGTLDTSGDHHVSADGSTVVGFYQPGTPDWVPARWRESTSMQPLSGLQSRAGTTTSVSATGSTVGGWLRTVGDTEEAFVWNEVNGPTILPRLAPTVATSKVSDMTPSGQLLVGTGRSSNGVDQAVRWTQSGNAWSIQGLGFLPGTTFSFATSISGDGSLIGGACGGGPDAERGFLWTQAGGMKSINDFVSGYGLDVTGWQFFRVSDISQDGSTFCTIGRFENVVYGVVITIPAPAASLVLLGAAIPLAARRRRL